MPETFRAFVICEHCKIGNLKTQEELKERKAITIGPDGAISVLMDLLQDPNASTEHLARCPLQQFLCNPQIYCAGLVKTKIINGEIHTDFS